MLSEETLLFVSISMLDC